MKRHPVKAGKRAVARVESGPVERLPAATGNHPFIRFHYSRTEISSRGGKARIASSHAHFEDGVLRRETFEGEFDPTMYERLVADVQRQIVAQFNGWLDAFAAILPRAVKRGDRD